MTSQGPRSDAPGASREKELRLLAEIDLLRHQVGTLQEQNTSLARRASDAEHVMSAFARGEIDAVTHELSGTPVLLHAAQEKLRGSEQLLRAIFDGALEPMVLTDVAGKLVDANPAACELYGLPLELILEESFSKLTGADLVADAAESRRLREKGHIRGNLTLCRADGTRRRLELSTVSNVSPGLDLTVMRDVTEQVEAEAAVKRSESRFRTLTEKSADVIALVSSDGEMKYVSSSVSQVFGWTPEEMIGTNRIEYVHPDDRARTALMHERLVRDSGEVFFEFRAIHRDGSVRWIEAAFQNLMSDPNVGAIVANLRDVTERVRAEQIARENHRRLEEAQAIAHVGSWTSGFWPGGSILWSREGARIFGVPDGTAMPLTSLMKMVHVDDRKQFRQVIRAAIEQGALADVEHRIQLGDGSVRWVYERGVVERDALGEPLRMIGTVQDVTDHHLALDALRASEAELRLLAEAMPQIVWITEANGHNVYFNQHWMSYTGLSLDESYGEGWIERCHPDDMQQAREAWRIAREACGTYSLDCRLRRADGVYRWWLIRGVPVHDANGNILKWFGTCTDIDALKQGKEHLRVLHDVAAVMLTEVDSMRSVPAALQVLGEYLRASRCAFAIVDADGLHGDIAHDYADGCESMKGRHRLSDLGARVAANAAEREAPVVVRDVDAELTRADAHAHEVRGTRAFVCSSLFAQGELRAMMVVHHATPRDWTPNEISMIQEVVNRCWVVIEKGAAEAKLRENEAQLRIAGRAARLGGWSLSVPEGRITWSEEVCGILEVPVGTIPSLEHAIEYYVPEFRPIIRAKLEACMHDGTPFDIELQITTETGRHVWVRAMGSAERSSSGAITMVRGAFQDIDDRRKLQDQYRQAQKMEAVGRLAGGVAHDFNNLLSVVLSYSELAMDSLKEGDPLRGDIEEIRRAGTRASGLTRQLLAFSRQQVLEPRVLDLAEVVDAMKPMLCRLLGEDVDVTVLSTRSLGRVLVDPTQIEQVVMNLAVNARDAMPDGGKLTLELSNVDVEDSYTGKPAEVMPGPFVMLAVTDSGDGMSEATRARVFEPFFTTKATGKGTGLGLATVFGIVQQSGGFVGVYSELEHGTTFKVYFPRTDRIAVSSTTNSSAPSSNAFDGTETILLVEDEDQVRTVACAILRRHGYNVLETSNGGEAFLVSNDFRAKIHLLLTDVVMPRISGRRLAEQLTPLRSEMKVLFVSGYTDDTIIHHGVLDSGVEFLQKPFTPHVLLKKVREVLDANSRPADKDG